MLIRACRPVPLPDLRSAAPYRSFALTAEANPRQAPRSRDILLTVSVAPHPFMTRDGNDIRMDLPVTLKEAVVGGKVPVPTLPAPCPLAYPPTPTPARCCASGAKASPPMADTEIFMCGWS